jgi:glycerate 2-kinase
MLDLLRDALEAVNGRRCTQRALADRKHPKPVWVFSIGKAACSMALGAGDALGSQLQRTFIATKDGHVEPETRALPNPEIFESAHPVPDARSLEAGERLRKAVAEMPDSVEPVFLISGGASSLVEALVPGVDLQELRQLNMSGLASGLDIAALNSRRREISLIKGGRLTSSLKGRHACAYFISDVPTDDPAIIGSGLLGPALEGPDAVERTVIASVDHAVNAVCQSAARKGLKARRDPHRFEAEAERLAVRFAHELRMQSEPVAVWGGESVMHLPEAPGLGGRNQHLALAAARLIAGHDDLLLLALGTDGTDGPTSDAGALVDGDTCARLTLGELDIDDCLRRADSGTALAVTGDLVHTGPTGTNVGDLVIGLKLPRTVDNSLNHSRGDHHHRVV